MTSFNPDSYEELEDPEVYRNKVELFAEMWEWVEKNVKRICILKGWTGERNAGEMIALMHSELSEALEGLRHGNNPSDHIPDVSQVEEEFADVVIRMMDMAATRGWNIPKALFLKIEYNKTRPWKHGGKSF